LRDITTRLESIQGHAGFEFTIQDRKLYMLQTRNGKRTGLAAVRVALQMVDEGLITKKKRFSASIRISCMTSRAAPR